MRGDRMRQSREASNLTQDDLAERAGIEVLQIWRYESGKTKPKTDMLIKIAKALHVSADYLLGLTDDPKGHAVDDLTEQETEVIEALRSGDKLKAIQAIVGK